MNRYLCLTCKHGVGRSYTLITRSLAAAVYFSLNTEEEMGEEKSAAPRMIRGTSKMAATADTGAGAADLAIVEDEAVEEAADAESRSP